MEQQVDLAQGLAALHDRLLLAIRYFQRDNHSMGSGYANLNGAASALMLMLFGHNGMLEGVVRTAARHAANCCTPEMADEALVETFKSQLPTLWDGTPVRQAFFAGTYVPATATV